MANNAHAGVIGQHSFDATGHFFGTVSAKNLPGMLRISDANTASVMNRHPGGAAGRIDEGI